MMDQLTNRLNDLLTDRPSYRTYVDGSKKEETCWFAFFLDKAKKDKGKRKRVNERQASESIKLYKKSEYS